MSDGWRVDVGGTSTGMDAVGVTHSDKRVAKAPSRSKDREASLLAVLRAVDPAWPVADDPIHGTCREPPRPDRHPRLSDFPAGNGPVFYWLGITGLADRFPLVTRTRIRERLFEAAEWNRSLGLRE